ncbi:MAG: BrnT family toxin [Moraxella sp.]|nr:BrnT family toxin [Moraxella sp.]
MSVSPISFDEAKRQANITKHNIDFVGCEVIFDSPMLTSIDKRITYKEQRLQSYGILNNQV